MAVTLNQFTYAGDNNLHRYPNPSRKESIQYYGDRNSFRMNDYHRLDLGYTTTKKTKWGERSWSFSLYNAYNQRNPFFLDLVERQGNKRFVQYSLFPIIPSFAYHFKF
jgi:hypothetical protein